MLVVLVAVLRSGGGIGSSGDGGRKVNTCGLERSWVLDCGRGGLRRVVVGGVALQRLWLVFSGRKAGPGD